MMASSIEAENGDSSHHKGGLYNGGALESTIDASLTIPVAHHPDDIFHDLSVEELKLLDHLAQFSLSSTEWDMLKASLRGRLLTWVQHSSDEMILDMITRIVALLDSHERAPFTSQRVCELVLQPRTCYSNIYKYLRAFFKVLNVTSSCEDFHLIQVDEASKGAIGEQDMQVSDESISMNLSTEMHIPDQTASLDTIETHTFSSMSVDETRSMSMTAMPDQSDAQDGLDGSEKLLRLDAIFREHEPESTFGNEPQELMIDEDPRKLDKVKSEMTDI